MPPLIETAYITGVGSGIGRAAAEMLASRGMNLALADIDLDAVANVAAEIESKHKVRCSVHQVDVADWTSQVEAFKQATKGVRVKYVLPIAGIGERRWIGDGKGLGEDEYMKPDLSVIDVDLTGVLYTCSLAIQHFRRQQPDAHGFHGKIITIASVCGFYCVPTLPIYTAAKHGIVGFTRSYGAYLPTKGITLNAVCPNVVQTNISSPAFYQQMQELGLLTPIEKVVGAVESFLGKDTRSGCCVEVGPDGERSTEGMAVMGERTQRCLEVLEGRGRGLQE